jgi:hypothetical protein
LGKDAGGGGQDSQPTHLEGVIGNIRCPYLVVNGKLDAQTAYTNTEELAREAEAERPPWSLIVWAVAALRRPTSASGGIPILCA